MDEVLSSALCAADWGQISRQAVARSPPVENRPPFVMLEWLPMLMGVEGGGGDESDNVKQGNNRTESKEERVQVAAALAAAALACPALRALPSSVTLRSSCRLGLSRYPWLRCFLPLPLACSGCVLTQPASLSWCSICLVNRLLFSPAFCACSHTCAASRSRKSAGQATASAAWGAISQKTAASAGTQRTRHGSGTQALHVRQLPTCAAEMALAAACHARAQGVTHQRSAARWRHPGS